MGDVSITEEILVVSGRAGAPYSRRLLDILGKSATTVQYSNFTVSDGNTLISIGPYSEDESPQAHKLLENRIRSADKVVLVQ